MVSPYTNFPSHHYIHYESISGNLITRQSYCKLLPYKTVYLSLLPHDRKATMIK